MSVYCDVCQQPGSLNDDAGYTTKGGWLLPSSSPDLIHARGEALAQAITKAAVGITHGTFSSRSTS